MGVSIDRIDEHCTLSELKDHNITVQNISATFSISGEFDLTALADDLPNSEYEPDKQRSLIYRAPDPENTVILLPKKGRVSVAGATNKEDILTAIDHFSDELSNLGLDREISNIQVENIVATTDLNQPLNLSATAIQLGLENVEYEPEQFPGAIYRTENAVILIFGTGKIVITSVSTYSQVLDAHTHIKTKISSSELV